MVVDRGTSWRRRTTATVRRVRDGYRTANRDVAAWEIFEAWLAAFSGLFARASFASLTNPQTQKSFPSASNDRKKVQVGDALEEFPEGKIGE